MPPGPTPPRSAWSPRLDDGACPLRDPVPRCAFRTWSNGRDRARELVGVELDAPVIDERSFVANLTNEGGVAGTLLLRNVTGLWMLDECRRAWARAGEYLASIRGIPEDLQAIRFGSQGARISIAWPGGECPI